MKMVDETRIHSFFTQYGEMEAGDSHLLCRMTTMK